ncbi:MAG TPA: hypothetical protein VGO59_19695 [Verrucomicrobiae bacterium]|jgi:hypothetical protein
MPREFDHEKLEVYRESQKLDNGARLITLSIVILTKVFMLKLLLGFGFGIIILALL